MIATISGSNIWNLLKSALRSWEWMYVRMTYFSPITWISMSLRNKWLDYSAVNVWVPRRAPPGKSAQISPCLTLSLCLARFINMDQLPPSHFREQVSLVAWRMCDATVIDEIDQRPPTHKQTATRTQRPQCSEPEKYVESGCNSQITFCVICCVWIDEYICIEYQTNRDPY